MTGIERLRGLARSMDELSDSLLDITGQVELELARQDKSDSADKDARMLYVTKEERNALDWVREHGGLDAVDAIWDNDVPLAEAVISELWPDGRPDECGNDDVMSELRRRLMPEGCEWPRFEDGPLLRYDDSYIGNDGDNHRAWQIRFDSNADVHVSRGGDGDGFDRTTWDHFNKGERVKRPAPKVLDADGAEIYEGRIAYGTRGRKYRVTALCEYEPSIVHAQALDDAEMGDEFIVANTGLNSYQLDASKLTHERLDSWERLEEDVANASCPDVYCANHSIDASDASYEWAMARDIVRRAKALAERDR